MNDVQSYVSSAQTNLAFNVDLHIQVDGEDEGDVETDGKVYVKPYVARKGNKFFSYTNRRLNYPGDVEVWVWNTIFQVHAAILRESGGYFRELLTEHWCGIPNTTNVQHFMVINDSAITPLTLKIVLDYLYFGKLYVTLDKIEEVYVAAEFLDIDVQDEDMVTDFSLSGIKMDLTGEERDIYSEVSDMGDSDSGKLSFDREGASSLGDESDLAILNTLSKEADLDSIGDSAICVETPRLSNRIKLYGDSGDSVSLCSEATEFDLRDSFESFDDAKFPGNDVMTLKGCSASDGESSVDTILSDERNKSNVMPRESITHHMKLTQTVSVQTDTSDYEDGLSLDSWRLQGSLSSLSGDLTIGSSGFAFGPDDEDESDDDDEEEEDIVEPGQLSSLRFCDKENEFVQLVKFLRSDYKVGQSKRNHLTKTPSQSSSWGNYHCRREGTFNSEECEVDSLQRDEGLRSRGGESRFQDETRQIRSSLSGRDKLLEDFAMFLSEYDACFEEGIQIEEEVDCGERGCLVTPVVFIKDGSQALCCYDKREGKWKEFNDGVGIYRTPGRRWFSNSHRVYCMQYQERSPVFQRKIMYYDCKTGLWAKSIPLFITTCSLSVLGILVDKNDVIYVLEGGVVDNALTLHIYDPNVLSPSWDIKIVPTLQLEKISQDNRLGIETDLVQFLDVCQSQGRFYFLYLKYKDPSVYLGYVESPDEYDKEWSAKEVMRISEHFYNEIWKLVGDSENMYAILVSCTRILIMKILPETCRLIHISSLGEENSVFPFVRLRETKRWSTSAVMMQNYIDICNFPSSFHVCRFDLNNKKWSSLPLPTMNTHISMPWCISLVELELALLPEALPKTECLPYSTQSERVDRRNNVR